MTIEGYNIGLIGSIIALVELGIALTFIARAKSLRVTDYAFGAAIGLIVLLGFLAALI